MRILIAALALMAAACSPMAEQAPDAGAPARLQYVPLLTWLGGAALVAGFSGRIGLTGASHAAVTLAGVAALGMLLWMLQRARHTLGKPHPGFNWYLAALASLLLALLAVPAMNLFPGQRAALRLFHLHLNLLGFVGLTAIGTLQVLVSTAAARPDPQASQRLSSDLKFAVAGALLLALGVAWFKPLALFGVMLYLLAPLRMLRAWLRLFADHLLNPHGAAASLACATLGLIGLLALGLGHALDASGALGGRPAIGGFVVAFLLPLVSGAVTQLLPVWLRPGVQGEWHARLRNTLGRWAGVRAMLWVGGGLALSCGWLAGIWLVLAGFVLFAVSLAAVVHKR